MMNIADITMPGIMNDTMGIMVSGVAASGMMNYTMGIPVSDSTMRGVMGVMGVSMMLGMGMMSTPAPMATATAMTTVAAARRSRGGQTTEYKQAAEKQHDEITSENRHSSFSLSPAVKALLPSRVEARPIRTTGWDGEHAWVAPHPGLYLSFYTSAICIGVMVSSRRGSSPSLPGPQP